MTKSQQLMILQKALKLYGIAQANRDKVVEILTLATELHKRIIANDAYFEIDAESFEDIKDCVVAIQVAETILMRKSKRRNFERRRNLLVAKYNRDI